MQFTRITAEDKLGYLPIHTSDQHEFRKRYNISTLLFVDVIGLAKQCIVRPIKAKKHRARKSVAAILGAFGRFQESSSSSLTSFEGFFASHLKTREDWDVAPWPGGGTVSARANWKHLHPQHDLITFFASFRSRGTQYSSRTRAMERHITPCISYGRARVGLTNFSLKKLVSGKYVHRTMTLNSTTAFKYPTCVGLKIH
jgi:hypothetical protein